MEEPNQPARILLVDDESSIRKMLQEILGDEHQCVQAASAEQALKLLGSQEFDLILSDIVMGGMSGLEMLPELQRLAPDALVIMISAEQTIDNAVEAMRGGAFDYITKPFSAQQVRLAVQRAVAYRVLRGAKRRYESDLEELVKQRSAELEHVSRHDPVTGLPNRLLFEELLTQAFAPTAGDEGSSALMFIDLDRFKTINDTLGYQEGDRLLALVAKRLSQYAREEDIIARIGGDEFALFVVGIDSTQNIMEIAHRLHQALKPPFEIDSHELFLTASIGISVYPADGRDPKTLLKNATAALYRAQDQGGDSYQFYTSDMNARALRRLSIEAKLRRGIERNELVVYYQPKIETETGKVVGMEALVRWQHPELGMIPPIEFIPLAEDSGLIIPLGEWVLRTACAQRKLWQAPGFADLSMSLNLSGRQFEQPDLLKMVGGILQETGLDSKYIELELTESSIIRNPEGAMKTLTKLREMGVRIAIDDFGTGYSSLSYLKQLPIDILKIDRSFVSDITSDPDDAALVMTIITMAHNLRLKVIAEGVETEEQRRLLRLLRCDEWQGFLCSKAIPADAFAEFVVARHLV
jgi:diguanylate cyclase (GGDEF)-like protein